MRRYAPLMRYLLIANPASGPGAAATEATRVAAWFAQRGDEVVVRLTAGPGHATRLAREASGYDAVIAGGGDGTINEVINGLAGRTMPLGIIPWGTTNVFAREMGLPRGIRRCARVVRKGRMARLDLGKCGERRFLMMAGAGIDAYALERMRGKNWKRLFGVTGYAIGAIFAFAGYHDAEITAAFPSGRRIRGSYVLVSNTRLYGGILTLAPRATPTDGLLDVFVYRGKSRWGLASFLLGLLLTPHHALQGRSIIRTTSVSLSSCARVKVQLDGDPYDALPLDISVEPAALSVILPKRRLKALGAKHA